jgi:hypothetical protein
MEVTVQDIINIPERFNIQTISSAQVVGYNYGGITTSAEVEGYKAVIEQYKAENEYLKKQNSDLLAAVTGKNLG